MEITHKSKPTLHLKILPSETLNAVETLRDATWLKEGGWYLAGGTALALQFGHRKSVDLDFFLPQDSFSTLSVTRPLDRLSWKATILKEGTIYGELLGSKISFIAYPYFVPVVEKIPYGNIQILSGPDIAVMKIVAISQRGTKRDFYDLYWYAMNQEPMEQIFPRLKTQYPKIAHNYHHILKSLTYFEDAESQPDPEIFFKADWNTIKSFFEEEVSCKGPKLLGLM